MPLHQTFFGISEYINLSVRQFLPVAFLAESRTRICLTATNNTGIFDFQTHSVSSYKSYLKSATLDNEYS